IYLATLPKSNSAYLAIKDAMNDLENRNFGDIPMHLKDAHYSGAASLGVEGYKYPHDYPNHYIKQDYLPKELRGKKYYECQNNKFEDSIKKYWINIKNS
ncbi:AAA family ATPase, partial [Clostridium sp. Sa3CVN1]|nr:AAA family ATPase [Clostridium cibarium]